jgi:hypothetical protein
MVILGLFINKWSIDECDTKFQKLAKMAFRSRIPRFLRRAQLFFSFATDSKYSSTGIEGAVKLAYGEDRLLFGNATSSKVAITGTTTNSSSTVIFSNYNGDRPEDCGIFPT